jgi:polar amino acid transport system substrate-binding protein
VSQTENSIVNELIPTGALRVGVAFAPNKSALFVVRDADGAPEGVTVDLGRALAAELGVEAQFTVAPNTGLLTDMVEAGAVDVAFMPVDEERKRRIAFGPVYFVVESTYLATGRSGIRTVAEVDRAGVRVVGIANTTTIRAAGRTLANTTVEAAASIDDAMAKMLTGEADCFALSRDAFPPYMAAVPGSRIVDGGFQNTGIAIAVQKGRPQALATVSAFLERAKADGTVRRALDAAGFAGEPVAPGGA